MVGNADNKSVVRDIERHRVFIAIFRGYNLFVFHGNLMSILPLWAMSKARRIFR